MARAAPLPWPLWLASCGFLASLPHLRVMLNEEALEPMHTLGIWSMPRDSVELLSACGTLGLIFSLGAGIWAVTHGGLASALTQLPQGGGVKRQKHTHRIDGPWFSVVTSEMQGWRDAMEDAVVCVLDLDDPPPCPASAIKESVASKAACEALASTAKVEPEPHTANKHCLFGVFDGHGGALAAKWVARVIHAKMQGKVRPSASVQDIGTTLKDTLLELDLDLRVANAPLAPGRSSLESGVPLLHKGGKGADGGVERRFDYVGCTACCAVMTPGRQLAVVNVGDSRAFKCRRGRAVPLSRDHKPESPRERKRIEDAGGFVLKVGPCHRVDLGLNLSRTLGDFAYKNEADPPEKQKVSPVGDIEIGEIDPEDEFLCIGCDGLYELMTWQTVCDFIYARLVVRGLPLQRVAEELLDACCSPNPYVTKGLGMDNESVIIVQFQHDKYREG